MEEAEDILLTYLGTVDALDGLPIREIVLLAEDALPGVTVDREKTVFDDDFQEVHLRVGFWAESGADARALAQAVPEQFESDGRLFFAFNRESGIGLPKPSREEHACFTAVIYKVQN